MAFYPDTRPHISPSAYQAWHRSRSAFVRSYFLGDRSADSAAMKAGKKIHALIEAGLLTVHHRFSAHEVQLRIPLPNGVVVLGTPDSRPDDGFVIDEMLEFVDYKSGKENDWDNVGLAGDLKMKLTAWLIYMHFKGLGKAPQKIRGYIEYIPTEWSEAEWAIVPTGGVSEVAGTVDYTAEELENFTPMILKTIDEINKAYGEWLESTDAFINQEDILEYAQLEEEVIDREARMELLKARIGEQMQFGKKDTYVSMFGTFYHGTTKTWDYPPVLGVKYGMHSMSLHEAEGVAEAAAIVKKKYETDHDPVKIERSLRFRSKKAKKK